MDWPLRDSISTVTSSEAAIESTAGTVTSTASTAPSSKGIGVPMIPESEILRCPPLAALCFRSIDAKSGTESILGDKYAAELADRLNITSSRLGTKPDLASELMCLRAMIVDVYCLKFADAHHDETGCTILNLTTGFDTRFLRLKSRPHVRWVEVDSPEFTHMRQRVFPPSGHLYRTRTPYQVSSATSLPPAPTTPATPHYDEKMDNDKEQNPVLELAVADLADTDSWLPSVPADRPTLVLMEAGAWMTPRADFTHIMRSVVDHFAAHGGRLVFDVMSRLNALMFRYKAIPPIRMFTFKIEWHCEDADALGAEIHPRLRYLEKKGYHDATTEDNEEWMPNFYGGKLRSRLLNKMPGFSSGLRLLFYEFPALAATGEVVPELIERERA
ncbi:S-adenosyl-L-methionine-dependent methyltransferase [Microdochium trichocladiopsis]|uniref:S-adenosyl-L-methionine-dependent methyltransferase n=1 Tax=Microdochium trichocladiopsis TaxID=1682393 RepID=A0A9P8Y8E9_9PEZI|nr:S-adenosyl-L-methionine-dependent methyltransferase [Microdochium trichocladiopsis]KAH7032690.1 S-adenosyl-L-methionine-dependent methyltransferase [Microdochium trichocladiopsis]